MDPGDIRGRADQTSPADHAGGHPWPAWAGAPEIHYVKTEDGYVAYQIFGEGLTTYSSSATGRAISR